MAINGYAVVLHFCILYKTAMKTQLLPEIVSSHTSQIAVTQFWAPDLNETVK